MSNDSIEPGALSLSPPAAPTTGGPIDYASAVKSTLPPSSSHGNVADQSIKSGKGSAGGFGVGGVRGNRVEVRGSRNDAVRTPRNDVVKHRATGGDSSSSSLRDHREGGSDGNGGSSGGDASSSVAEIEQKAEGGDAESQFLLGCLHARRWQSATQVLKGKKSKSGAKTKDVLQSKAMAWLERAARQRHQNAMYALAQIGLDPNVAGEVQERAVQWLKQAAEIGMPSAQALLGEMHGKGYISADGKFWMEKNYEESFQWLSLAAESG